MENNMACQSTIGSRIGRGPSIAAPNQAFKSWIYKQFISQTWQKNITNKAPIYHKEKEKLNGDGTYLCKMKEMQKNESKSAQWKLGGQCQWWLP